MDEPHSLQQQVQLTGRDGGTDRGEEDETPGETLPLLMSSSPSTEQHTVSTGSDDARPMDNTMARISAGGLFVFTVITCVIVFSKDPPPRIWFALHPTISSLSLLLFGLGIITLQTTSKANLLEKERGFARHQLVVLVLALPTFVAGFFAIWYNRQISSGSHYKTWHGVLGLILFISVVLHTAAGSGMVWADGRLFGGGDKAKRLYRYHRIAGYMVFIFMLLVSHNGGAWSSWFQRNTNGFIRFIGYVLAPLVVVVGLAWRTRLSKTGLSMSCMPHYTRWW